MIVEFSVTSFSEESLENGDDCGTETVEFECYDVNALLDYIQECFKPLKFDCIFRHNSATIIGNSIILDKEIKETVITVYNNGDDLINWDTFIKFLKIYSNVQ